MTQETFKQRQARGFRAQAGAVTENDEFLALNQGKIEFWTLATVSAV